MYETSTHILSPLERHWDVYVAESGSFISSFTIAAILPLYTSSTTRKSPNPTQIIHNHRNSRIRRSQARLKAKKKKYSQDILKPPKWMRKLVVLGADSPAALVAYERWGFYAFRGPRTASDGGTGKGVWRSLIVTTRRVWRIRSVGRALVRRRSCLCRMGKWLMNSLSDAWYIAMCALWFRRHQRKSSSQKELSLLRRMLQRCESKYHSIVYRFICFSFHILYQNFPNAEDSALLWHSEQCNTFLSSPASAAQFSDDLARTNQCSGIWAYESWCQLRVWRLTTLKR